jgi:hypothetical protein
LQNKQRKRRVAQALEDAESTESKGRSENREVAIEEFAKEIEFGADNDDHLKYDQQPTHDRPEDTGGLIGYGASTGNIVIRGSGGRWRARLTEYTRNPS